ncbi:MAG: ItsB [uncultured bacterium]|nr:MAG: ItsB [uncultured bacterium]
MKNLATLIETLNELRLEAFAKNLEQTLDRNPESREVNLTMLTTLTQAELAMRGEKSIAYRIREAHFQQIQTIETFDFNYNASTKKIKNRYIKFLEAEPTAADQGLCALFVGTSGLGKTHLARALGYRHCQQNKKVLTTTVNNMLLSLTTAESTGTLRKTLDQYINPALLIIDEVGYVSLRELESNLIFQVISARYDRRRSTVVTTNRPFGEWNQIFHNDAIAHAILDRLAERAEVFHVEGKSYRETHPQRLRS